MDFNPTKFPLAIVSTDTTALRELSWALAAHGYQVTTSSDWSEQAPWRRSYAPALVILDARDEQQVEAALAVGRSNPYTYRIAIYDANLMANPDVLMDLGADDLICYPLNVGEMISCIRRGARRLEFERRFNLCATFDQHRGVANRRGFTLQLERKLQENDKAADGALVVLGIDFLDAIREEHGSTAVENACSLAAEMVYGGLSAHDSRGILAEGVFAVLLQDQSVSDGILFVNEVNEQFATIIAKGICLSLSGVVVGWPSGETAENTIQRGLSALEHIKAWGGKQILDIEEVEREYTAWQLRFAVHQPTDARHAMEALPLVLPLNPALSVGGLGIASFTAGHLPPCVPVVDDVGHLVGVVAGATLQAHGQEVFNSLDEHLEPVATTLRSDSRFEDIVASFDSANEDYLLVVENKKPIGYVTQETVIALQTKAAFGHPLDAVDRGLNSLVVPLI